ncbi:adenosine deaminase [Streptomyces sp. NPDC001292]|uniref:adenosine deaminase family protein n=1 Tax=Streptomyces sp. NPDC001292 TaxID=3364558 RepID=UPI003693308E
MQRRSSARRRAVPAAVGSLLALSLLSALSAGAQPAAGAQQTGGAQQAADGLPSRAVPQSRPATVAEARTDAYLRSLRARPVPLRGFFVRLPKGGDLHNHLSGAVSTEYLIELAAEDGLCVETATLTAVAPPCRPGTRPAADARADRAFHDALVRAWSMEDFPPGRNGHDHFFDTFGKFGEVTWRHRGKLLAQVADHVAGQNQFYLETMVTPASDGAKQLAAEVGWDDDLAALHRKLVAGGKLDRLVAAARKEADDGDAEFSATERCGTHRARPGCRLTVRWVSQASRGSAPERVFTQLALGMRLAERDPRFVAVNLVQPEDGDAALRDYSLQMRMVRYLRGQYPKAHVTLHAGELWPGLVKPQDLRFHIAEAVDVARTERVGHGVDLVHEDRWQSTARTMAARQVAVEVPFTSNAQILGVKAADHPFTTYRRHGVPIVLATDDPGVSRIDISHEYQYAATTYGLSYPELKDLARASLQYAFLPGASLWRGDPSTAGYRVVRACRGERPGLPVRTPACRRLLSGSPRAELEWRQEAAFAVFERTHARAVR